MGWIVGSVFLVVLFAVLFVTVRALVDAAIDYSERR